MFEIITEFIKPELIILIPVLYILGMALKKSDTKDKNIPFFLGGTSIFLCVMYVIATSDFTTIKETFMALFTGITQGILCAGGSVYFNQAIKQYNKDE